MYNMRVADHLSRALGAAHARSAGRSSLPETYDTNTNNITNNNT